MYYPLSQITTNLYSNNNLVIKSTEVPYTGYYWKTSDGKYFVGKTPQSGPKIELKLVKSISDSPNPTINPTNIYENNEVYIDSLDEDNIIYSNLKGISLNNTKKLPVYFITLPTEKDYKTGEFRRYFCKKTSEITYLEISKDTYNKLIAKDSQFLYEIYVPFNVPWLITGDKEQVYKVNKNVVELAIKNFKLYKFKEYLRNDFAKYYK